MSRSKGYLPGPDAQFDGWLANLTVYVNAQVIAGAWTHIPADKVDALNRRSADWHSAYGKTAGPHTSADTETKNDARAEAEAVVRPFVARYLKFDPVTNEDRAAMRLHSRKKTRSRVAPPSTRPLITGLKALGGFQVEVRFQDEGAQRSRAIPYGCSGCLLYYVWGPEKITDYAALTHTLLMTRSPFVLPLPPDSERKFLSCAARWQNERGELGPWSEIQHTVII